MYSRGSNAYGQQSYGAAQQAYGQNSILGGTQDADNVAGYRAAAAAQYGGQYGSVYGSSALGSAHQAGSVGGKVAGSSSLQGRPGYASAVLESPNFASSDYPSLEKRNYVDHQSAYMGRDLQSDPARRYAESASLGSHRQADIYDRIDQASLLRQQQLLKSQALQSASLDVNARLSRSKECCSASCNPRSYSLWKNGF